MKTIILAGGFGTRISEYSEAVPKPMIHVGGKPILWHIMNTYAYYGHKRFYLALGYKSELIKEYFLNYRTLNADFTIDLGTGSVTTHQLDEVDWTVTLVETGIDSMTGGRVKRMKSYIGNETCLLTYGDGLSNIDIGQLIKFHQDHGKMVTVTAVHPGARFGELEIENGQVVNFQEKPQISQGWINGGYFVIEPEFFDHLENEQTILEKKPLEKAAAMGELMAYHHDDFWHCMDTKRDRDNLENIWISGIAPWKH
jgi:glucose-1-phosphate cytidylyltransferase